MSRQGFLVAAFSVGALGAGACYREASSPPQPVSYGWSVQEPMRVLGPPGGAGDPGTVYPEPRTSQAPQAPGMPGYPAGYPEGYPEGYPPDSTAPDSTPPDSVAVPQGSTDPAAPGYATGAVTDAEIDATL